MGAKVKAMVKMMKTLDAADKKITKASLKNAASTLKKAGIPAQVKTLKAMDKRLHATVKRDVMTFIKEGKALDKIRMRIAKKRLEKPMKEAHAATKAAVKAI